MTCKEENILMFQALRARLFQGYRTGAFPPAKPNLPPHFQGRPLLTQEKCPSPEELNKECPTGAFLRGREDHTVLDCGKCIFCGKCAKKYPEAIRFTDEYRLGSFTREGLYADHTPYTPEEQLQEGIRKMCGKSLKIRQVSAGGCAACELDFNVLHTLAWDMGRFGIQAVASPRHADCILVTGPVSENMLLALKKTYEAMPEPCFVIASGTCAVSGGIYQDSPALAGPLDKILKVDLYVPGCPPHPATLLEALLRFMGRQK